MYDLSSTLFRFRLRFALVGAGLALGCAKAPASAQDAGPVDAGLADAGPVDAGPPRCDVYAPPVALPAVASPRVTEASGLAMSRRHEGVLFTHNDSGDTARFFAVDAAGATRGEYHLAGAQPAQDIEDMAWSPCTASPTGSCLWLGDIGDNLERRADYVVYRTPEPDLDPDGGVADVDIAAFPFTYPDGPHNAETLLVHPLTGTVYVVTKVLPSQTGPSGVYRFPALTPGVPVVLEKVGTLLPPDPLNPQLTAGDLHPTGTRLLLRTYVGVFELRGEAGEDFEALLAKPWQRLPTPDEPQGEGIGYTPDGLGYVTLSEGAHPTPFRVGCKFTE
jgi:hypothetical protein